MISDGALRGDVTAQRVDRARRYGCGSSGLDHQSLGGVGASLTVTGDRLAHDAEGVQVGRARGGAAQGLLGTEVRRRAEQVAGPGVPRGVRGAGDAEVGELHQTVLAHQDVGRLHVSVHDLDLVGDPECEGALADDRAHVVGGQPAVLADDLRQRLPVDQLHDQVRQVLVLAVVEQRRDVGVDQGRRVQRLVAEAESEQLLVAGVGSHHLDGDVALQHLVVGRPHIGHAAGGDPPPEAVPVAQHQPWLQPAHVVGLTLVTVLPLAGGSPDRPGYGEGGLGRLTRRRGRWAQQGSNLRPLACKASALPLSYAPERRKD